MPKNDPLNVKNWSEVKVSQSCSTLCDPMDCSLPGFSVHGILQARILEWVAIPISRGSFQPWNRSWVSHIAGRFFSVWATREAQKYACLVAGRQKLGNGSMKLVKKYLRKLGRVSAVSIIMQWQLEKGEQRTSLQTVSLHACMRAILLQSCSTLSTLWTMTHQAPLYMGFSRQEYWSGSPCPPPGALPDPGVEYTSLALAGGFLTTSTTWEAPRLFIGTFNSVKFL